MIDHEYIYKLLEDGKKASKKDIREALNKAKEGRLSHKDIAILLHVEDKEDLKEIFKMAGQIKKKIYGNRIVIFAPLYISDYCINNCLYCGYKKKNDFKRRRLSLKEIQEEVRLLEKMGHKRLAIEAGEDPINCDIDYMVDAIKTVYDTYADRGEIRRVNVNIAATTVENYRKLKEANIGTYILFQETYHKPTYEKMVNEFKRRGIPYITVINKIDLVSNEVTKKSKKKWNKAVLTSTRDSATIFTLKEELIKKLVSDKEQTLKYKAYQFFYYNG